MSSLKRLVYVGLGAMVVFTGGYLVVYTARWEWQRSLMAGELLLVSMIVLLGVAGADRLHRMERRLTELIEAEGRQKTGEPGMAGSLSPAMPGAPNRLTLPYGTPGAEPPKFRWLQPDSNSYGVFIPVLLGAGIAVSGLAALVERIASRLGRGSTRRLSPLEVPAGGVLAGASDLPAPRRRRGGRLRILAWVAAIAVFAGLAIGELAERTQDRPDQPVQAAASTLVLEASTNDGVPADPLAQRLWEYCRGSTRPYLQQGGLTSIGGGRYAVVVQPALGEHAMRRLRGCLQDSVVDHGRFKVVSAQPEDD